MCALITYHFLYYSAHYWLQHRRMMLRRAWQVVSVHKSLLHSASSREVVAKERRSCASEVQTFRVGILRMSLNTSSGLNVPGVKRERSWQWKGENGWFTLTAFPMANDRWFRDWGVELQAWWACSDEVQEGIHKNCCCCNHTVAVASFSRINSDAELCFARQQERWECRCDRTRPAA